MTAQDPNRDPNQEARASNEEVADEAGDDNEAGHESAAHRDGPGAAPTSSDSRPTRPPADE